MDNTDVLHELDRRGLRAGTIRELAALGEQYPDPQLYFPILVAGPRFSVSRTELRGSGHSPSAPYYTVAALAVFGLMIIVVRYNFTCTGSCGLQTTVF